MVFGKRRIQAPDGILSSPLQPKGISSLIFLVKVFQKAETGFAQEAANAG
jgi:hypothetical protein